MSWASRRRSLILLLIGSVAAAILAVVAISIFYETPSCSDGKENQDETGVDCGGSCERICIADVTPPKVVFVRALQDSEGNADIVAYLENTNPSAYITNARFSIELYSPERVLLETISGTAFIPPASVMPLYIPRAFSGPVTIAQSFVLFEGEAEYTKNNTRYVSMPIRDTRFIEGASPRITAVIQNPTVDIYREIPMIATALNAAGIVIADSSTLVPQLYPGTEESLVFTWNAPFAEVPSRIEVRATTFIEAP